MYLKIGLLLFLIGWVQAALAQIRDTIVLNTTHAFEVTRVDGYTYQWWFADSRGEVTPLFSTSYKTEEHLWNTEGEFRVFAQARDANGCLSEIVEKAFVVVNPDNGTGGGGGYWLTAGNDTLISSCSPYRLRADISTTSGFSFEWTPADGLDDPTLLNPVFTPGSTTTFVIKASHSSGIVLRDTVLIAVSDVLAEAGENKSIAEGEVVQLDGSQSLGAGLQFQWTTLTGNILSGDNTASPIVNRPGTYYLTVVDSFGCVAVDSVIVTSDIPALVANDDNDTTVYQGPTAIDVIANDQGDKSTVFEWQIEIIQQPAHGKAEIDYSNVKVIYTPDLGFSGSDYFIYRVCNSQGSCDDATVRVVVKAPELFIPEAFTPNGDNINDYFEIKGIEYFPGNDLRIFNRWGRLVYHGRNYGIDTNPRFWDGTANVSGVERMLPDGTYFYILDLGNGNKRRAGSVYFER